jgi:apolipoprotein N-acyltransferase
MTWSAVICAIVSGAGIYFSFNLGDQWWLAWLAPVPVLWLAFGPAPRRLVFAASFAAYGIGLSNILPAYDQLFPFAALATIFLILPAIFALLILNAAFIARRVPPWAGVLGLAALLTAFDYLMSTIEFYPAFITQAGAPMAIQSAAILGPWAISFLLGAVSGALALGLRKRSAPLVAAGLVLFAANLGLGALRLAMAPKTESVRVGLASSDSDNAASVISSRVISERALARYAPMTRALAAEGARLIVLPEEVARLEPEWRSQFLTREETDAMESKADLVIGFRDHGADVTRNIALFFPATGGSPGLYAKRRLIPGVESNELTPGNATFIRPDRTGVQICRDMDDPTAVRADAVADHPNLLTVPAWDFDADGWGHARFAILRGVEDGFSVARAARRGLLTLTDAYGRVIAVKASAPGMASLVGDLPRGPGDTLYMKIGDVFAWICLVAVLLFNGLALFRRRRSV